MAKTGMDRTAFSAHDVVRDIWSSLKLPPHALQSLHLPGQTSGPVVPSSFKIGILAQSSIALAGLAAALLHAARTEQRRQTTTRSSSSSSSNMIDAAALTVPQVRVPLDHAVAEFRSESLYSIEGDEPESSWNKLGGLHATKDGGYVRIHDAFPNHALGMLRLLGLPADATRRDVAAKTALWDALELEDAGTARGKLAIYALRSYAEWDALPQARAVSDEPILLRQIDSSPSPTKSDHTRTGIYHDSIPRTVGSSHGRCLQGIRVLEMSRVIAAPVAGKTLAAYGADVLWVTSPHLPDIPNLDRDLSRGKRSIQLDLNQPADARKLRDLLRTCDVFLQGYRPGSLSATSRGLLSPESLGEMRPGIVCANLSAFGPEGPWAGRRGFDSLVQTCSGMNASEAEHAGEEGEEARAMPCQALDHASGYLLATGIMAALYRRTMMERSHHHHHHHRENASGGGGAGGHAHVVDVSLAGTMKYLRSLGQYPGPSGFAAAESSHLYSRGDVPEDFLEQRSTPFGKMKGVRHSAEVEGCRVGWDKGPSVLGGDEPEWLPVE